jgi:hypothetical protein
MSETPFLKCPCQHCGGSIEFPAHGVGLAIDCPHCGTKTKLFRPEPVAEEAAPANEPVEAPPIPAAPPAARPAPRAPKPRPLPSVAPASAPVASNRSGKRKVLVVVIALIVVGALAGGGFYLWKERGSTSAGTGSIPASGTSASTDTNSAAFNAPVTATKPKKLEDLNVGNPALEKAKSGSLVYAVGVLKNDSDHQRYGVRVDFDLLDASGNKVGKASDYKDVIEPRNQWRYRALVLTRKAASARLVSVNEDP